DRLEAALHTLTAVAEVKPDGVEWEPHDRRSIPGQDSAADQVRWTVHDGQGRIVDRSVNLGAEDLGVGPLAELTGEEPMVHLVSRNGQPWRLRQQRMQAANEVTAAPRGLVASSAGTGAPHPEADSRPPIQGPEEPKHDTLILTTGI